MGDSGILVKPTWRGRVILAMRTARPVPPPPPTPPRGRELLLRGEEFHLPFLEQTLQVGHLERDFLFLLFHPPGPAHDLLKLDQDLDILPQRLIPPVCFGRKGRIGSGPP